jgi:integrase/recombinase XerD
MGVPQAAAGDFVLVNLFREPAGAPMPPDAINALVAAVSRRAGLARRVTPHQLRHAMASNLADSGATLDEVAELIGHSSVSSSQVKC